MNFKDFFKKLVGFGAGMSIQPYLLKDRTIIFMFHRVVDEGYFKACNFEKSLLVTEKGFEFFLDWVTTKFSVIPLSSLINKEESQEPGMTRPQAVITFDDGWRDNFDSAFPLLCRKGVPATIFLSTDYLDSPLGFWWQALGEILTGKELQPHSRDEIRSYLLKTLPQWDRTREILQNVDVLIDHIKEKGPHLTQQIVANISEIAKQKPENYSLSWEQCREMSTKGIEFGSHTLSHPRLPGLAPPALERELKESKAALHAHGLNVVDALCYPYGYYDANTLEFAKKHYKIGVTTERGTIGRKDRISYTLPRINIPEHVSSNSFLMQYRLLKASLRI